MIVEALKVSIKMMENCEDLFPKKAHEDDAGYDLKSRVDMTVFPGTRVLIPTGITMALPVGYEMQVRSRSGLAYKSGIFVLNSPGTVDCIFRGEVGVILYNTSDKVFEIKRGDRIAQGVINEVPCSIFKAVDELPASDRGTNGFGSTGKS